MWGEVAGTAVLTLLVSLLLLYRHVTKSFRYTGASCTAKKFGTTIPRKGAARSQSPNFHIHVSVSDLHIYSHERSAHILLQENRWTDPGNIQIAHRHMNVEIGTEIRPFLAWEYINC
jgi:hypothetical protein